jgi:hypothetical protein
VRGTPTTAAAPAAVRSHFSYGVEADCLGVESFSNYLEVARWLLEVAGAGASSAA